MPTPTEATRSSSTVSSEWAGRPTNATRLVQPVLPGRRRELSEPAHLQPWICLPSCSQSRTQEGLPEDQVTFVESPFETCGPEGPFDCVIGSSVLHHLDLESSFAKIFELLGPGGRMSFAEPNMLNPQVYPERRFRRFFPSVTPDETAFDRSRLRRDLEAHGFRSVEIEPFDWLHPATPPALIGAVSGLGRLLESGPGF